MNIVESIIIAISMYSKIPMPKLEWNEKNMKYVMCFFPLIGVIISLLMFDFSLVAFDYFGETARGCIFVLIPVIVTGGIHLDGFLDTSDALSSYQTKERRLEILKDPHTGAFAIISGISLFLINVAIWSEMSAECIKNACMIFIISRCFSALAVAKFPCAKDSGLLHTFSSAAQKKICTIVLIVVAAAAITFSIKTDYRQALCMIVPLILFFVYYRHMSEKNFGGITGDLAGWFLQVAECVMALGIVIGDKLWF